MFYPGCFFFLSQHFQCSDGTQTRAITLFRDPNMIVIFGIFYTLLKTVTLGHIHYTLLVLGIFFFYSFEHSTGIWQIWHAHIFLYTGMLHTV